MINIIDKIKENINVEEYIEYDINNNPYKYYEGYCRLDLRCRDLDSLQEVMYNISNIYLKFEGYKEAFIATEATINRINKTNFYAVF